MNIYRIIEQYIIEGKTGILATVIRRLGSAPRDTGAKMFIGEDGRTYGTIGGGKLELDVFEEALKIMGKGLTRIFHVRMNATTIAEQGMLCGGDVDILLEPVDKRYLELYREAGQCSEKGKRGIVITRFGHAGFLKTFVGPENMTCGDPITDEQLIKVQRYFDQRNPVVIDGDTVVEPLIIYSPLYIFGAGHVSQFISKVAKIVDFYVVVIDDRAEFASKERFPDADEIIVDNFDKVFSKLDFTGKEYAVIVTRGHSYDAFVLQEVLKRDYRYVGMIGSRRKIKIIFDNLKEMGYSEEVIKSVHAPIGIDIDAETPQEIAVSIVAELIQERAKV
ncbi:MAG: XdhC family protein [Syntrophorhabdaceae bacterium]|nr:XdhC family protein [Syntrophorhabdaceae bacterium]